MSFEKLDSIFAEQSETQTPLEKFERLLGLMENLADRHAESEKGWHVFPQRGVTISRDENVETQIMQLFVHIPMPLEGYEGASYSPNITMVLGLLVPEENTGKLSGSIEKIRVKKSFLEEGSPYYEDKHIQATTDLERIDKLFLSYKTTLETLRPA